MLNAPALFRRRLLAWYDRHRRDLPWRLPRDGNSVPARPDPYRVLVSEFMLQQTQVATVVPYFHRFLERFPTLAALASADEQDVLRQWQGLGYYSRARNLQAAARAVVERHGGALPCERDELLRLPGVGRYTAGAIASIAFGKAAPILDGNVSRVLCRLDRIETDAREPATLALLWRRAEEILPPTPRGGRESRAGDFNSALMELGATVCTPRAPQCLICPVREHCEAYAAGVQDRVPAPRKAKPTPLLRRWTLALRWKPAEEEARCLIEQRPPRGRWAGMWQFVTVEAEGEAPPVEVAGVSVGPLVKIGEVTHALTHRRYTFEVFVGEVSEKPADVGGRRWVTLAELDQYPLPRPQLKIVELLRGNETK